MPADPVRLTAGSAVATIDVQRGGRLASWTIDGRELLIGPPTPGDRSIRWGCFLMAPWAGRLADGRFRSGDGTVGQVPRTFGRNAIHGLMWDREWTVEAATRDRAVLVAELPAGSWAPGGVVRHEIRLGSDRLELDASLTADPGGSRGATMPAAIGWHPWLRRDAGRPGELALRVDSAEVLRTVRMLPTGEIAPVEGRTDLRRGPALGRRRLDHAYVSARGPAVLSWPDLELVIDWEPSPSTLVVHTPPSSVCVEPQTAWPNAPGLGPAAGRRAGLRLLGPGESLEASMSMTVRRRAQGWGPWSTRLSR